ncbi:MAG: 50S ribosomal protein L25 [Deltaproteobacteria bacterium]|nr:50S ribosomal protein L25 [Deltaproteobacteria bacterium]
MHNVAATPRPQRGKGAARRLRHEGKIPAVAYGKDLAATPVAVVPKDILSVLKSERGQNTVIQMKVEGAKDFLVMIKSFSVHPVARTLEHVDFVEVKLDRAVDVEIPLVATGKAIGLTQGGILRQVYRTVPVRCLPDRIPLKVEVDVTSLELGDSLHANKLPLPEGVEVRLPPEQTVIAIVAPEKDRSEEEAAGAPGAPGAAAPAAGAAPAAAAAGAKPAAGAAAAAPAKDAKKK